MIKECPLKDVQAWCPNAGFWSPEDGGCLAVGSTGTAGLISEANVRHKGTEV